MQSLSVQSIQIRSFVVDIKKQSIKGKFKKFVFLCKDYTTTYEEIILKTVLTNIIHSYLSNGFYIFP